MVTLINTRNTAVMNDATHAPLRPLAEAAKNAPLISFQRSLVSQTSLIIAQYESGNRSHCSYDEHMLSLIHI